MDAVVVPILPWRHPLGEWVRLSVTLWNYRPWYVVNAPWN